MSEHDELVPFQIAVGPRVQDGVYTLRAVAPQREVRAELALPPALIEQALRSIQPDAAASDLGRQLGQTLFAPPVRELLLATARNAGQRGARLQLQLQIAPPEVAALPWEWLSLGASTPWRPAIRDDYALVRVSRRNGQAAPLPVTGPLRVLVAAARGEEPQADALEAALADELPAAALEIAVVRNATPQSLESALRRFRPHILHLAAPAAQTTRGVPRLLLGAGLEAYDLMAMLEGAPEVRLIVLAGSLGDTGRATNTIPLLATALLSETVPATIAFAGGLPPRPAARFAAACYRALAAGAPVDLAVTAGRRALAEGERGWGLPQLRLAPGCEHLFTFRQGRGAWLPLPRRKGHARTDAAPVAEPPRRVPPAIRQVRADGDPPRRATVRAEPLERPAPRPRPRGSPAPRAAARPATTARRAAPARPRWLMPAVLAATALLAVIIAGNLLNRGTATTAAPAATAGLGSVSIATLVPTILAPSPTPAPGRPGDIAPPQRYTTYLTTAGDTLESVAARTGSDPAAIAALNFLTPGESLRVDRPLVIPVYREAAGAPIAPLIMRGNPATPNVALTFDVELDDTSLYGILEVLRARGIKATFFFPGRYVETYPDAVRAAAKDGHELGNHSTTHPYFSRIGPDGAVAELQQEEDLIRQTTGLSSRPYFRFPYGDYTETVLAIVARQGYVAVHWSADDPAIAGWLAGVAANPADGYGGILLMHGRPETVANLPGWIDQLEQLGLKPTTLTETLR